MALKGNRRNADDKLQARIVGPDGIDKPLDGLDVLFNGERPMAQIRHQHPTPGIAGNHRPVGGELPAFVQAQGHDKDFARGQRLAGGGLVQLEILFVGLDAGEVDGLAIGIAQEG